MYEPPAGRDGPAVTLASTSDSIEKSLLLAAFTLMAALTPFVVRAWLPGARIVPTTGPALAVYVIAVAFVLPGLLFRISRLGASLDTHGATIRRFWHTERHGWPQVSHLADGGTRRRGTHYWALDIVLRSGRTVTVNGPARGQASSATLAAIGRVAAHHQIPAELDGIPRWRGEQVPDTRLEAEQDWQVVAAQAARAKTRYLGWLAASWGALAAAIPLFAWAISDSSPHHKNPWILLVYAAIYFWGHGLGFARAARRKYQKLEEACQAGRAQAGLGVLVTPAPRTTLAVAAGVGVLLALGVVIVAVARTPAAPVQLTWYQVQAGDCLRGELLKFGNGAGLPDEVTSVPCQRPHLGEVVFTGDIWSAAQAYPGDDAVAEEAYDRCASELTAYEGKSQRDRAAVTYESVVPSSGSWAGGDRSLTCVAYKPNGQGGASVSYSIKGGH
jgi:hypothetical protein